MLGVSSVGATTSGAESSTAGIVEDDPLISPLLQFTEEELPSSNGVTLAPLQFGGCVCRTSSLESDADEDDDVDDDGSSSAATRLASSASRFDASRLLLSGDSTASAVVAVGGGDVLVHLLATLWSLSLCSVEFCGSCCCCVPLQLGSSLARDSVVPAGDGSSLLLVVAVEAAGDSCETRPAAAQPVEYSAAVDDGSTSGTSSARAPVLLEVESDDEDEVEDAVTVVELTKVIPSSDCWWWCWWW